jgi:hypothetical protein
VCCGSKGIRANWGPGSSRRQRDLADSRNLVGNSHEMSNALICKLEVRVFGVSIRCSEALPCHPRTYIHIDIYLYLSIYISRPSISFLFLKFVGLDFHRAVHQSVHTPVLREYSCRSVESLYSVTISPSLVGNSSKNEWLRRLLQVPMQVLADL